MMHRVFILILLICLFFISCESDQKLDSTSDQETLFKLIQSKESGVTFKNNIVEDKKINFYRYQYLYNGGGVGIGDVNNDNLPDLYFTSTQGFDKLYLNQGDLKFKDVSAAAGINRFPGYKTGVNMIDINEDGWLDIYVCRSGWTTNKKDLENLLFINQKDGTFKESAKSFNLNDGNRSIQSAFFDYDKDGDLDVYVSNHPEGFNIPMVQTIENIKNPKIENSDRLFRNDGNQKYTDVTSESGVLNYGYGLGTSVCDFNNDGLIDIYVTSDFSPRDLYYVNQGDGTFKEELKTYFPHASYFAMGVDATDINNDGALDLFIGEMLAEDNQRQKTNMAPMDMKRFSILVSNNMYFQYMRNSFFVNNGNGHFSDVAHYSGIDQTDWSWSVLFGDYDLDGDNDLLVANGWLKDTQDKDFSKKSNALAAQTQNRMTFDQVDALLKSTPISNYAFKYDGNLTFSKTSAEWGFDTKGFSNGMASGDLDNDGDLDIVINNINDFAGVYENTSNSNNYLKIKFEGYDGNISGLNTKVQLIQDETSQFKEFQTSRGFQSSVEPVVHFGVKNKSIDKIILRWADGNSQTITNVQPGQTLNIKYNPDKENVTPKGAKELSIYDLKLKKKFVHQEQYFDDYKIQVLLPHMFSQLGPALATGDLNGDNLDDIFIGGAADQSSQILLQNKSGEFQSSSIALLNKDKSNEDIEALFFDVNNDGHLDIYIGSGSSEFINTPEKNRDRIYINNGKGQFGNVQYLPIKSGVTGCVAASDFDNDGYTDLFIGSRVNVGSYPMPVPSYILKNNNGKFEDETKKLCPALSEIGMINSAEWTDVDGDSDLDLVLVGEWTDLNYLENSAGKFELKTLLDDKKIGWWNSIKIVDLDKDGYNDILVGNLGKNYKYEASDNAPFEVFSSDFDKSGNTDIVLGYHQNDELFPVRGLQCSSEQLPGLKSKFNTYEKFGSSNIFQVYGESLNDALHYKANSFESAILWNNKGGQYKYQPLPFQAQLSPIQDFEFIDIDGDQDLDIIAAGNWYVAEIETPRADSGQGVILENKGNRKLESLNFQRTGFLAKKDVRQLAKISNSKSENIIIIGNNNGPIEAFKIDIK